MSILDRIRECAQFDPARYIPFRVEGVRLGMIKTSFADVLRQFEDVFRVSEETIDMVPELGDSQQRTDAMDRVLRTLRDQGRVAGWRDEAYPVGTSFSALPLFTIERAAVPLFGVKGYGVHVNGFVNDGTALKMWIGRRSLTKPTGAGLLDQVVAGGQPVGMSLSDNLIKECAEEAGLNKDLAATAVPVGTVSYRTCRPEGLRDDVLFNFDLELPPEFQPINTDGEVEAFYIWPIERVMETLERSDEFKFNSALVIIDFLVRHGLIGPDDPDYVEIVEGLHRQSPGSLNH